jgi:uncharacterized RDD family membrane protein YckC
LSAGVESFVLAIQPERDPIGPLVDLPLGASARPEPPVSSEREPRVLPDAPPARTDLPLFPSVSPDDAPLVTPSSVPRAPLAVRRGPPPAIARPRHRSPHDAEPALDLEAPPVVIVPQSMTPEFVDEGAADRGPIVTAGPVARIAAGLVDVAILAGIDVTVLYLTLRLSSLPFDDVLLLPKIPFVAFLLLLNGGYLVLFTAAGGQTIGKMAAGIRVIPQESLDARTRVPLGTAVLRAAAYLASALPLGLGFLPILFSSDRRTVHDRLSDTRVVKA